jgi:hypothetical protein
MFRFFEEHWLYMTRLTLVKLTGRPDWANFRLSGDYLLFVVMLKIMEGDYLLFVVMLKIMEVA